MQYRIRLGIPEFKDFLEGLILRAQEGTIDKNDARLFKKLTKAITFLSANPRHNSLNSHEISELSERYSSYLRRPCKVWQSYLENNTPKAGRLYWIYGPNKAEITLIGIEPHPESQKAGYEQVRLSNLPPLK